MNKTEFIAENLTVRHAMTSKVMALKITDKLDLQDETLSWRKYRHIPVIDADKKLKGLVSHRDLMNEFASSFVSQEKRDKLIQNNQVKVEDVMIWNVTTIRPEDDVRKAARTMYYNKCGCLPVVDSRDVLVGIITEADLVKLYAEP